ncbi:MAG: P-type conjugative transfer protein TrbG [Bryobacteraceae bacterium]
MKSIPKMVVATTTAVALMVVITIVLAQKRAKAAQSQDAPSVQVNSPPAPEVGAAPNATYGEAMETPNQRRRRLAAEAATGVPSPEQYPFTEAIQALKAAPSASGQPVAGPVPPQPSVKKSKTPKETRPKNSVSPSPTGKDAVEVSDRWQSTRDTPAEGKDGRVIYSEGAGMPTVVCAPLRLCVVELQPGERLTGDPQIGDSVRWNIEPASYGLGELTTPMILIKPKAVGLDTNLVITTDRRIYYLRLMSSSQDYVARVSFEYPDDSRARWSAARQKQAQADREAQFDKGIKTLADSVEGLNVDYRIKGDASIRPIRVLDDGVHTYIQMNPEVLHREAPVLAILGPSGKAEMVNYRVQGSVYVVDRLFDRGRLILGSGRKALKADIMRGSFKERRLFARDPFRDLAKNDQTGEDQPK